MTLPATIQIEGALCPRCGCDVGGWKEGDRRCADFCGYKEDSRMVIGRRSIPAAKQVFDALTPEQRQEFVGEEMEEAERVELAKHLAGVNWGTITFASTVNIGVNPDWPLCDRCNCIHDPNVNCIFFTSTIPSTTISG